jgi:hypothetical protein
VNIFSQEIQVNKDCQESKVTLARMEMMAKKEILDYLDQPYVICFIKLKRI